MNETFPSGQVALLSLFQFRGKNRFWAMRQMAVLPPKLKKYTGLQFFKVLGTGAGLGYSSLPDFSQWGLLTVWPSVEEALDFYGNADLMDQYRLKSYEDFSVLMRPIRSKGQWSGLSAFEPQPLLNEAYPIAVLTRAQLKLRFIIPFWQRVGGVSRSQKDYQGQLFSQGVGERPWIHQATFSIWEGLEAMEKFAYGKNSKHLEAIKVTRQRKGFKEELYARFQVIGYRGTVKGRNPLEKAKTPSLL
ncbi:MAG: hypothetical protein V2I46_08490 [Bacteroides sp.]|jgi:hypothetical protein|nr:hypothetical protein [Bacteroides sp.]